MILSQQTQTIIEAIKAIPITKLDQSAIKIQVRQDIETKGETIIIWTQNARHI